MHRDLLPELLIREELRELELEGIQISNKAAADVETALSEGKFELAWDILDGFTPDWKKTKEEYALKLHEKASSRIAPEFPETKLYEHIYGAWLGRCSGCLLGKPVECWHHDKIKDYLTAASAFPLTNYFPKMVPYPEGLELHKNAEFTTLGNITGMCRDDDIDYTILGLMILEEFGKDFTTSDVALTWLQHLPVYHVFTAEAVAYRNLLNGLDISTIATYRNPYREWIGAQIRADIWGYINPGNPAVAAEMALRDASLSHNGEGVYGEVWAAACIAAAFNTSSLEKIIQIGLEYIPEDSRLAIAIKDTIAWCREAPDSWEAVWKKINEKYGRLHMVHVIQNTCVIVMALMLCGGDFEKAICLGVMGGWDTDCTGATIGSIMGAMLGKERLPDKWISPLKDHCLTAIAGASECQISSLAERTLKQINR